MTNKKNVIILAMCNQLIEMIVKLAVRLEREEFMTDEEKKAVQHNSCMCQTIIATKLGATREELVDSVEFSKELNNLVDKTNNQRSA